ncbi:hypothetical protein MNV49_001708 [Pseudohyphozyma bogoriensis]|nr:hypothetical protein MNV49_001708 [Pseudohyphozyma bogoriensis]
MAEQSATRQHAAERYTDTAAYGAQVKQTSRAGKPRRWLLNGFEMSTTGHITTGLWRHPKDRSASYHDIEYWQHIAKTLERGKFNGIFIADCLGAYDITHSVTYEAPFTLSRRFATLDHLTKGRAAINVVTSILESSAKNFGLDEPIEHDERYRRADEYMDVLYKLWESSWRDDAVKKDVERNVYADPTLVRTIDHIRTQVDALRSNAAASGRDPYSIKVVAAICVILDETDEKAAAKFAEYGEYASTTGAATLFGGWTGQDLSVYDEEADLRDVGNPAVKAIANGFAKLYPETKTWRAIDILNKTKIGGMGHPTANFSYVTQPGSFEDLVEYLVPELQKRFVVLGVHWLDYPETPEGRSLTAREGVYGVGESRLRKDHYGSRFSWKADQEPPFIMESLNALFNACNAWLSIVIFKQTYGPRFKRGFWSDFCFIAISIPGFVLIWFLHKRQLRRN